MAAGPITPTYSAISAGEEAISGPSVEQARTNALEAEETDLEEEAGEEDSPSRQEEVSSEQILGPTEDGPIILTSSQSATSPTNGTMRTKTGNMMTTTAIGTHPTLMTPRFRETIPGGGTKQEPSPVSDHLLQPTQLYEVFRRQTSTGGCVHRRGTNQSTAGHGVRSLPLQ